MAAHELDKESQQRFQNAYEALRLADPDGYTGTVEREYQKELARNLQKDGNKAANVSTDQRIAGKLKVAGYSLHEIEEVIEHHSPMAVKPSQEQRQAYAKTVIQKAYFSGGNEPEKKLEERRLDQLGIETKIELVSKNKVNNNLKEFKCTLMDRYYSLFEYAGVTIHLPMDMAYKDDDATVSVYSVSQATYQDTGETLQTADATALENYLTDLALKDGIDILIE